jgi:hypothetical protein
MTVEVMTQDDIQAMLKLDPTNTAKVVDLPSFPAPVLDLSQKARRWLRGEGMGIKSQLAGLLGADAG